MGVYLHDTALRTSTSRATLHRLGAARPLEDDHIHRRFAAQPIDRADGLRRAHGWSDVPRLGPAVLMPDAATGRHRGARQPEQPQGCRSSASHRGGGCKTALSSTLLARLQSHRKVLLKTQNAAPQSRKAIHRRSLGRDQTNTRQCRSKRMFQLLRFLRICIQLN